MAKDEEPYDDDVVMAKMVNCISLGMTLEQAKERGIVKDANDEELWAEMEQDVADVRSLGGEVTGISASRDPLPD